jgi:hypothetical protein
VKAQITSEARERIARQSTRKDLALPACYAAEVIHSFLSGQLGASTILLKVCLPRLSLFLGQLAYLRVNPLSRRLLWQVQIIDTENRLPVAAGANSHRVTMNIRRYRLR